MNQSFSALLLNLNRCANRISRIFSGSDHPCQAHQNILREGFVLVEPLCGFSESGNFAMSIPESCLDRRCKQNLE